LDQNALFHQEKYPITQEERTFHHANIRLLKIPQLITIMENIIVLVRVKEVPIINQNPLKKDISYE
jgi:hypothetical protein